jgi:hypothetical protein
MLAEFYLYNGNKLRISQKEEFFLIEKYKQGEIERLVQCNIADFFPYVQSVRMSEHLKHSNPDLFKLIQEKFKKYEKISDIPNGSLEKNPFDLKNGCLFFGEVSTKQLFGERNTILNYFNPEGKNMNVSTDYLKFKDENGSILFVAKIPIKHSISWNSINGGSTTQDPGSINSAVYGSMQRDINGNIYKIRLLTGGNANPATDPGGEWDRLIVGLNTYDLNIYNDSYFGNTPRKGISSWVQEQYGYTPSFRANRGYVNISLFSFKTSANSLSQCCWRTVLEWVP